jgi:tetratricopeptide (TPR) repeat protein
MATPSKKITKPRGMGRAGRIEMTFLEQVRRRCPAYRPVNEVLGDLYTKVGRFEDGLDVDLTLTRSYPDDPYVWYNLGCSYALTGQRDEAFVALGRAVDLGYADFEWFMKDDNLGSIRSDLRFLALLLRMRP